MPAPRRTIGLPWTRGGPRHEPRSVSIETGWKEPGDRCPNCDFPIADPEEVVIAQTPSAATWTCPHCGWVMKTARHGTDDHSPRPGRPH